MIKNRCIVLMALGVLLFAPAHAQGLEAKISDFVITTSSTDVLVYFKVRDCFTRKMEEAIFAGIPTTFTFSFELYEARSLWFDRKIVSGETRHTLKYDTVKKVFYVSFSGDGRGPLEFTEFNSAKRAMEEVNAAAVASLSQLARNSHYYIKVKAKLDTVRLPLHLEYVFFFVSLWDFETDWYRQDFVYK